MNITILNCNKMVYLVHVMFQGKTSDTWMGTCGAATGVTLEVMCSV